MKTWQVTGIYFMDAITSAKWCPIAHLGSAKDSAFAIAIARRKLARRKLSSNTTV